MGALPQLYAGTSAMIFGGEMVGPSGLFGIRGYPKIDQKSQHEYNASIAQRLWNVSTELTGVDFAALKEPLSIH
ncbi:hypothetical protein [Dictyobacter arantiisoli]|uniref:Uncharacterized protein n=1 Tax=Dictyobacter arantiisoli TaxID=2014874 RepID=A0A5A5TL02_9CHLR|nr:hypothetical protein [Dictyobacter arantiisoli]GCF11938.1 hypothetical protein KDI_55020 [Dictyobacter arantiisoli]